MLNKVKTVGYLALDGSLLSMLLSFLMVFLE